jgi:hypothetical protein
MAGSRGGGNGGTIARPLMFQPVNEIIDKC